MANRGQQRYGSSLIKNGEKIVTNIKSQLCKKKLEHKIRLIIFYRFYNFKSRKAFYFATRTGQTFIVVL